jgi:hypothetical protein
MRGLADLFCVAKPLVPAALAGCAAVQALTELATSVPQYADTFGFEARLTDHDGFVDLGLALAPVSAVRQLLENSETDRNFEHAIATDERWRRLREFARRWTHSGSSWLVRVPFLFLEYDADGPRAPVSVPSVFVGLDWRLDELTAEARSQGRGGDWLASPGFDDAIEIARILRREPLLSTQHVLLARSFATLPDNALVLHLGIMLGRAGEGVRLSVIVPRNDIRAYLSELGWNAGLDQLDRTLDLFAPHADFSPAVQIDFDVSDAIGSAIGLTLQPADPSRWPDLLDALVTQHLCTKPKRDALLAWPGRSVAEIETTDGCTEAYVLERDLSHAKVTVTPHTTTKAKAYFGVTPRPIKRR